ncbi:hypothetical protein A2U01_0081932, partial [Trifolium medium]|nr:hypothetical protein [Trifolium medium]
VPPSPTTLTAKFILMTSNSTRILFILLLNLTGFVQMIAVRKPSKIRAVMKWNCSRAAFSSGW